MEKSGHGLVLGKFLPPHAGHQHLVQFAQNFVEHLTVLACSIEREPIPGALRFAWMCELFPRANVVNFTEELPQEPSEHPQFWPLWRSAIRRHVPTPIDYVFASEDYGYRLAAELGAKYIPVDRVREMVPISGTEIRRNPLANWRFIPPCVRPYFVKRVCLFGPESTGKSTLAAELALALDTVHVSEFARGWLDPKQGICEPVDIPIIARGQIAAEDSLARQANRVLVCDTDPLLTTIWSEVLFGDCPKHVKQLANERRYDLYLLTDIDIAWVDDRQRFLPHQRREFFERCRQTLEAHGRPYRVVRGSGSDRCACALAQVREHFGL